MSQASRHRSYAERLLSARRKRKFAGKFILAVIALALLRTFVFQVYRVGGGDMEPALRQGDLVLVFPALDGATTVFGKLPGISPPQRGRIVLVFPDRPPNETWAFFAWDSIARFFTLQKYSPLKVKYGAELADPVFARVADPPADTVLGTDEWYLLADNRNAPVASALRGPYSRASIAGRVVLVFWPPSRMGFK